MNALIIIFRVNRHDEDAGTVPTGRAGLLLYWRGMVAGASQGIQEDKESTSCRVFVQWQGPYVSILLFDAIT